MKNDFCTHDLLPIFCDLLDFCIEHNDSFQVFRKLAVMR